MNACFLHVTISQNSVINSSVVCVPQGITYDHVELNLYLNGKNMHCPASGIRGTVYPVVYGKFS